MFKQAESAYSRAQDDLARHVKATGEAVQEQQRLEQLLSDTEEAHFSALDEARDQQQQILKMSEAARTAATTRAADQQRLLLQRCEIVEAEHAAVVEEASRMRERLNDAEEKRRLSDEEMEEAKEKLKQSTLGSTGGGLFMKQVRRGVASGS